MTYLPYGCNQSVIYTFRTSIYDVTTIVCATSDEVSKYDATTIACATSNEVSKYDVTTITCDQYIRWSIQTWRHHNSMCYIRWCIHIWCHFSSMGYIRWRIHIWRHHSSMGYIILYLELSFPLRSNISVNAWKIVPKSHDHHYVFNHMIKKYQAFSISNGQAY
jgi:hypothetical protein